ncbi:oligosaccharide flippase family protein [candidate division KSB1 bacterium]|nr:oligosaccharide flippase family protein [candidate division KSB1 bacterium]NIR71059.1 oligosaccharide flippase family protein [candidate division KSB1 bacterium]NIS24763.1 oligosaccharide flippase family protein [candidate division KSB1 bacterium]NIT71668.1 oligosaccharide flippase family protein [candidate division KSB1 bacterium]NIU25375.1 oligosaccharide flippase family protein [candidate division KSB1 bacterium]
MSSALKNIVKHSGIYSAGKILANSIGFLLIPVYTRYLTPADYGTLEILTITGQVLITVCTLGIGNGLLKVFLHDSNDDKERKQAATIAYVFVVLMSVLVFGPAILFSGLISKLTLNDSSLSLWFAILFLSGLFSAVSVIPFQVYRAERQSVRYTLINLLKFVLVLGSNIFFVVVLELGVVGVLYGSLIGALSVFVVNFLRIRGYFVWKVTLKLLKKMLRFGLPLLPAMLAIWMVTSIDRYLLAQFSDLNELGLYSMGMRFAIILEIVFRIPFDTNWPSIYLPLAKKANVDREFSKLFTYYLALGLFLALGLSLFAKPAIELMTTPDFYGAYAIVPILVLAFLFRGISSNVGIGIWLSGKTKYQAFIMIGTALVNIVLNIVLISPLGMLGAALATLASFGFMALVHYVVSQKFFSIRYEARRILKLISSFCVLLLVFYLMAPVSLLTQLITAALLCLSFPALLFLFNFFTVEEMEWLRKILKRTRLAVVPLSAFVRRYV